MPSAPYWRHRQFIYRLLADFSTNSDNLFCMFDWLTYWNYTTWRMCLSPFVLRLEIIDHQNLHQCIDIKSEIHIKEWVYNHQDGCHVHGSRMIMFTDTIEWCLYIVPQGDVKGKCIYNISWKCGKCWLVWLPISHRALFVKELMWIIFTRGCSYQETRSHWEDLAGICMIRFELVTVVLLDKILLWKR